MLLSRKISEVFLMKNGIQLSSIKEMTEKEVMEYLLILGVFNEIEAEKLDALKR